MHGLLLSFFACQTSTDKTANEIQSEPVVELDWGSWQIDVTFQQQDVICSDLGADGQGLRTLYGEMTLGESPDVSMSLGDQALSGTLTPTGFEMDSFRPIEVTGEDPEEYGIGAVLTGTVLDLHTFSGTLVYQLDFPAGFCNIVFDAEGSWMYYEPPPPCNS